MFNGLVNFIKNNDLASSAILLLLLSLLLHFTQVFSRVDNLIYDLGQHLNFSAAPKDVVIIAIDEDSLSQLGRWPWSREVHANLLARLKPENPAVIGFDVIFSQPDQANPIADAKFSTAVKSLGNVVLSTLVEPTRMNGQMIEVLPMPELTAGAADLGRVNAPLDQDSIARSVYLYEGAGTPAWQLFAQAVINVAQKEPSKNQFNQTQFSAQNPYSYARKDQRRVNFFGPSGYFYRISYAQVLKGEFAPGQFTNKIVLIGATALGMSDFLTTPVSGLAQPMAGVEFHANVLESIRKNKLVLEAPLWLSALGVAVLAILPLIWMPKMSALTSLLANLFLIVLVALSAGLLPSMGCWAPPSAAIGTLLLAYPIWSWRKLDAAQRYLDNELQYLRQHLKGHIRPHTDTAQRYYDKFDARIEQVKAASEQLRYLQNDRKETLAFISHDLRAPLANAIMLIEQGGLARTSSDKIHQSLRQAHHLAEDFLQASRAEAADVDSFNELDFAGLVHEAIDAVYELAVNKQMTIEREVFEGVVWVRGNFGLLERAIQNLITNAVKYGLKQTTVIVRLSVDETNKQALFSVTDVGLGISDEQQQHLFKRFSRVKGAEHVADGSGLGLYFVKTVIEKHQGEVAVASKVGHFTTFSIKLPMMGVAPLES